MAKCTCGHESPPWPNKWVATDVACQRCGKVIPFGKLPPVVKSLAERLAEFKARKAGRVERRDTRTNNG